MKTPDQNINVGGEQEKNKPIKILGVLHQDDYLEDPDKFEWDEDRFNDARKKMKNEIKNKFGLDVNDKRVVPINSETGYVVLEAEPYSDEYNTLEEIIYYGTHSSEKGEAIYKTSVPVKDLNLNEVKTKSFREEYESGGHETLNIPIQKMVEDIGLKYDELKNRIAFAKIERVIVKDVISTEEDGIAVFDNEVPNLPFQNKVEYLAKEGKLNYVRSILLSKFSPEKIKINIDELKK